MKKLNLEALAQSLSELVGLECVFLFFFGPQLELDAMF